jgi:hypothetical protein
MNTPTPTHAASSQSTPRAASAAAARKGRLGVRAFYPAAAAIIVALDVWGFQHFYLHGQSYPGREITPPIRTLVIAHGLAMSAWLVLFMVQPSLIAVRRPRVHMTLGRVGVLVALAILGLGLMIAIESTRALPPDAVLWGLGPRPFMAIPFFVVLAFAGFVGVGIWKRKRPAVHKAMMLLGTLAASSAGISRIDELSNLYLGTMAERLLGPFVMTSALAVILLAIRCALIRSIDRWLAIGTPVLIGVFALIMVVARTAAWDRFAAMLVGTPG